MQKSDCIIGVEHVSKFFGDKAVLNDVNLSVRKGEFVTILGPSGCGKTTLLRLIAGFQTASEGIITIAGKEITQTPPHKRPVNTVFQKYALFPHLNVFNNIAFGLKLKKLPAVVIEKKVKQALKMVGMTDYEYRDVDSLSGGQQQRVAIARAIVNEPEVLLLDEPLAALDLKMRKDMQMELKEMHKSLGITFIYVTHDQEEALTLSDTIVVMSEGKIQQIGTPIDIYNEPINSFVADFIGESNILNGLMIKDKLVSFAGHEFECVDEGFGEQTPVDVVLRPEDIYIFEPSEAAMLTGTVTSSIFKGVHYEMMVQTPEGYEFMVQDYHCFDAGQEVGLLVKPFDIHVMKKERICNTFEGKMVDATHVEFLGCTFECREVSGIDSEAPVQVEVDFDRVILEDNEEDGRLTGEVKFILYKGNHYHLTVFTDWDEDIFVDTNDVWDDGDRVGITIAPENIRIVQSRKEVISKISAFFMRRKNWTIPYALFLAVFVVMPLLLIVLYAFTDADGAFTFANFRKFMVHPEAMNTFVYSIGIAIITTLACLILGYPAAYILSQERFNTSRTMVVLFILPMWVNILIRTLATVALFDFLNLPLGEGALVFGMVYNFLPFMIYPIYNTLQKMDRSLIEAAQDLGANPFQVFMKTILPLSMPGVMSGIVMVFMPTVSTFAIAELLTMNNIKLFGTTVQENIYNGMWNYGAALSLIMLLLIGVTILFTNEEDSASNEGGGVI